MGQQFQALRSRPWRPGDGEKLWLSTLIDTMEEVSRPELRSLPCDAPLLAALRAQLSHPASPYAHHGSRFGLRH
jgi:hypothetical protein